MKIVHVVEAFAGGVFDFLVDLTHLLDQHQHIIIHGLRENTPDHYKKLFPVGTTFYLWKNAGREISITQDFAAFFQLMRLLQSIQGVDIIHLHSAKAGFLGRAAAWRFHYGENVVYTPHGAPFLRNDISSFHKNFYLGLEKLAQLGGGKIIACSHSEQAAYQSYGMEASAISNGTKLEYPLERTARRSPQFVIGTMGRVCVQKNPILFNKIAEKFLSNRQIKFLWIGDGADRSVLTSPNITITGWLDQTNALQRLDTLDVYLSTSSWEGLPLAVLQAMTLAKPLVLSNCIGNCDLVIQGENGYQFSNLDEAVFAVNQLINNREKVRMMGQKSRELVVREYSIERMAQQYDKLYHSLAGRCRHA